MTPIPGTKVLSTGSMLVAHSQIEQWLREDLGHYDVTNEVPGETTGQLIAQESGIVSGTAVAREVFNYLGIDVEMVADAGERVILGDVVLKVTGEAREILRGERIAVNIVGHASGIATKTRTAVNAAREVSSSVRIAGTRKTTPGLRGIEKRAIAAGGGDTHRLDLSHMVLIKENHITEMGLETAIARFCERASFTTKVEVEVEQPMDGRRAAEAGADIVLFDNLAPAAVAEGVEALPDDTLAEVSGGIGIETIPEYATTGVDVISLGSLTHSARTLDFSFLTGEGP